MKKITHSPAEYNQITENIWIGTNMCCMMHNKNLLLLGFDADIDLEDERPEEPPHTRIYLWLPTPDHHAPAREQLRAGTDLLSSIVSQHLKVYVHCKNGHGRGPTLVAAYLIDDGQAPDDAIAFIKTKRPSIHIQEEQRAALKQFKNTKKQQA